MSFIRGKKDIWQIMQILGTLAKRDILNVFLTTSHTKRHTKAANLRGICGYEVAECCALRFYVRLLKDTLGVYLNYFFAFIGAAVWADLMRGTHFFALRTGD